MWRTEVTQVQVEWMKTLALCGKSLPSAFLWPNTPALAQIRPLHDAPR